MKHNFYFDNAIDAKYSEEIRKKIYYINDNIEDFNINIKDEAIESIEIFFREDTCFNSDILETNLTQLIKDVIKKGTSTSRKIWENIVDPIRNEEIIDELVDKKLVYFPHQGQVTLTPMLIKLYNFFDNEIKSIVINEYSGIEHQYPTLIPVSVLKKINYLQSFPHFFMGVAWLHNDLNNYNSFIDKNKESADVESYFYNYCSDMELCLPPTMCYHTYNLFENSILEDCENYIITSKGKSFRYETKYAKGLERLWDFTIREIVFMGNKDFVNKQRSSFRERIFRLFEEYKFKGYCEVANDPFFISDSGRVRHISQKILELKHECRFYVNTNKTIAVGSFNYHDDYFGKSFNIKNHEKDEIITACAGFGLERLVYAFLCQYGLEIDNWPDKVQIYLKG